MEKVHIIAEAGSNYNGDVGIAKNLIDIGKRVNANSVKFQIINTYGLYLPGKYEYGNYDIQEVLDFREKCNISELEWEEIFNYGRNSNIELSASVFDKVSLKILIKSNPEYIKIASSDLNNIKFLLEVGEYGKKMIISTGMATLAEIDNTVNTLYRHNINEIVLMHCVSAYPAELQDMNIGFIDTLRSAFGFETGFSDHTKTSIAACLALTKGVKYIEKHFTIDNSLPGLDHKHAMNEENLMTYVQDIRNAETALEFSRIKIGEKEEFTKRRARRALYAARFIPAGQSISEQDILVVRPQGPMSADKYFDVVGKKALKSLNQYEPFTSDSIAGL